MSAANSPSRSSTPSAAPPVLKSLVAGQILCREGDPPGPMYVICSGTVRAFRRSRTMPDTIEQLAELGPGDVVCELAPMLQQTRSATVQAIETTEVVEVPVTQVHSLMRRHESLLRVIGLALKDRAGLSQAELQALASDLGVQMPTEVLSPSGAPKGPTFGVPPHDPAIVYPKSVSCPACGASFYSLVVHVRKDQPVDRSSDFHQRYVTPFNPYDYELWVCPNDLYAALPADFATELTEDQRLLVRETVDGVIATWGGERPNFNGERSLRSREQTLLLALALYRMREASPSRLAAVLHRLAWCARERGQADAEQKWLTQALEAYTSAFEASDLDGPRDELRVQYLCGELHARLGDAAGAVRWFGEALRHPGLKEHPSWERMIREQWAQVRGA